VAVTPQLIAHAVHDAADTAAGVVVVKFAGQGVHGASNVAA
jgi:hypothetical protein